MSLSDRTPGGAQTRSKQHSVFGGSPFPQTAEWAYGSKVHAEGTDYIDWMAALASVGLGYCNPSVVSGVMNVVEERVALPLPSRLEYEVADLLCHVLKWPEQVRFVKTGSEATAAAMMMARRATGRKKVISIGYHGWHECHLPSTDLVDVPWGGIPAERNYPGPLQKMMDSTVAAVIMEPMRDHSTTQAGYSVGAYLNTVQTLCKDHGALFILDEMVTGFRWAIGGATEFYNLSPDLACYGKAMANGYPLACVVGGRKLMKYAHDVSSTFGGECVGLAAAKATIGVYQREPVIARLWEVGRKLQEGVPQLQGYAVHPHFTGAGGWTDSDSVIPLVQYAAQHGVLMHPSGLNPMFSHSDSDIARTVEVLQQALSTL